MLKVVLWDRTQRLLFAVPIMVTLWRAWLGDPFVVEQMMDGKPITITDPNMTRFMMTLDDAVDLVVYAFTHGENGDLFVQKAPAATLEVLAQA